MAKETLGQAIIYYQDKICEIERLKIEIKNLENEKSNYIVNLDKKEISNITYDKIIKDIELKRSELKKIECEFKNYKENLKLI